MKKNDFLKIYSKLLDKFTREGFISNYIEVDYCNNGETGINMFFTDKFFQELKLKTELKDNEIINLINETIKVNKIYFNTDDKHKKLAFDSGFRV